jgi:hypothetical protein
VTLKCRSPSSQLMCRSCSRWGQVCIFVRRRRKFQIPSSTAFGKIGEAYVQAIHESAQANGIPVVQFQRRAKQRENRSSLSGSRRAPKGKDRVVLIGIAQEKPRSGGPRRRRASRRPLILTWSGAGRWALSTTSTSTSGTWTMARLSGKPTLMPPYPIWLWLNGHETGQTGTDQSPSRV